MLSIGIILLMTSAELRNSLHVVILAILLIASLVHFWNFPEIIPTQTNIAYWIRLGHLIAFQVAERFRQVVNANESIETKPARLGGDEFILIARAVPGANQPVRELVRALADDLIAEFSQASEIDGKEVVFSASFGLALYPEDGVTAAQLMKAADVAMYQAKRAGKNRYRFFGQ